MAASSDFQSVDEYIAAQSNAVQSTLRLLRGAIREAVPGAREAISYNMPTYTLHGSRLLYFAAWKEHTSIYAATAPVMAAFRRELARYDVRKGTIKFPLSEPVPVKLIARIAKFRATEIAAKVRAKTARPKTARKDEA